MDNFSPHLDGWYDVAEQMRADLGRRVAFHAQERRLQKDALRTVEDFETYRDQVRGHLLDAIGGLPGEKTALRPRVTGTVQLQGYRIEKLLFESLPDYLVSAACYIPDGRTEPGPAVLFFCGHASEGKAHRTYQQVCIDLVNNGFVVLAIDPIGQGERLQYWRDGQPWMDVCTLEHTHAGLPFFLQGGSVLLRHFVWDGIRAFDYLLTRPEVDGARIGATGNSGGGTQVSYLMLCEPRLAAAVPCTFLTSLEAIFKSGNPQDMEQIVPGCMVTGPDHDDIMTALAPKPVLVGAVAYDFFPLEGTLESVCRARQIYELYGRPANLALAVDPARHCYSAGLRQACVNWFKVHLQNGNPDFATGDPPILPPGALRATASGQVLLDYPRSKSIFDISLENAQVLPGSPGRRARSDSSPTAPTRLRAELDRCLGVSRAGSRQAAILPRLLEPKATTNGTAEKIWFFSAPEVAVAGVLLQRGSTANDARTVTLLLRGSATDDAIAARAELLLNQGQRVFVFDPRGSGASASRSVSTLDSNADFAPPFDTEYFLASQAAMLGLSSLGLRVFDVLRAYDYLRSRPDVGKVALHGMGTAALWAYLATALEVGISDLTCEDMLLSYRELCADSFYNSKAWALPTMAFGLLRVGDLADMLPCIAPRGLRLLNPLGSDANPVPAAKTEAFYAAYTALMPKQ